MKVSFNSAGNLHKSVGQNTYENIWHNLKYSYLDRVDCEEAFEVLDREIMLAQKNYYPRMYSMIYFGMFKLP